MTKPLVILLALALTATTTLHAADPTTARAPTPGELARAEIAARIKAIEEKLRSLKPEDQKQGIDDLKAWIAEPNVDSGDILLRLQNALATKFPADYLALIESVLPKIPDNRAAQRRDLVGHQIRCQFRLKQFDPAIAGLKKILTTEGPGLVKQITDDAITALLLAQRPADVEDIAQRVILGKPEDTQRVEAALQAEIKAYGQEKKYDKAAAAGKQLFAVAAMARTSDALLTLARQLPLAYPEDKTIADQFQQEQVEGAELPAAGASSQPAHTSAILAKIKVDADAYAPALKEIVDGDYESLMRHGNLLLLSDNPKEARSAFETALALSADKSALASAAAEGIARSIKAADGTIGRANAYAQSVNTPK